MFRQALVTGPDPSLLLSYRTLLGRLGYLVESIPPDRPVSQPFSVAIVDVRDRAHFNRLTSLAGRGLIMAVTEAGQEPMALHSGADEVIVRPDLQPEDMAALIAAGLERTGRPVEGPLGRIIGRAPAILRVLCGVGTYARSQTTVLICGETGTGKEVIARALHQCSPRSEGPFVPINCAAIPDALAESEIFGHVRGAFTGAGNNRPGRVAAAEGGTLFLDEVGELSLAIQAKLLRLLQEQEYVPVGENLPRRSNVRIVAATNRDLQKEVLHGRFRSDLYWRLEVLTIDLPALRQRPEDVMPLCYHVIDRTNYAHQRRVTGLVPKVESMLMAHDWPGNVRELENTIERAVILRGEGKLQPEDVILRRRIPPSQMLGYVRLPPDGLDLQETTTALETLLIDQALEQARGNRSAAARLLNINRTTLVEKLRLRKDGR